MSKLISTSSSQLRYHPFWLNQPRLKTVSPHTHICGFCCSVLRSLLSSTQSCLSSRIPLTVHVLCKWGLQQPTTAITLNQKDEKGKAQRCFTSLHIRLDSPWPPGFSINIYAWGSDPTGRHVLCLVPLSNQMSDWSMMCISIQWADGGNYTFYWDSYSYELVNPGSLKKSHFLFPCLALPIIILTKIKPIILLHAIYLWFAPMTQVWLIFWVQGFHWWSNPTPPGRYFHH